jgi:hypothetical protein
MIWARSGALALAGLVLLAVAAAKLMSGVQDLRVDVSRIEERAAQAGELQERLNAAMAEAQRVADAAPKR